MQLALFNLFGRWHEREGGQLQKFYLMQCSSPLFALLGELSYKLELILKVFLLKGM